MTLAVYELAVTRAIGTDITCLTTPATGAPTLAVVITETVVGAVIKAFADAAIGAREARLALANTVVRAHAVVGTVGRAFDGAVCTREARIALATARNRVTESMTRAGVRTSVGGFDILDKGTLAAIKARTALTVRLRAEPDILRCGLGLVRQREQHVL